MLAYFERRPALKNFKSQISSLKTTAESCCRQLCAWADSLQNSDIKGQRHLNEKSRQEWENKKDRETKARSWQETELKMIKRMSPNHPLRIEYERRHGPIT